MNAGVTKLQEQPSGARRLALFAVKKTAIGALAVGVTSESAPSPSALSRSARWRSAVCSQTFDYRSCSRSITRYR